MRLRAENQYRGIPDLDRPDIDLRHDFATMSALPTGVEFYSAVTGGSEGTVAFEGLDGGRINMTVATSGSRWLRFPGWDLATPTKYRRALFECVGLYFDNPGSSARNYFVNLRDTTNITHGVFAVFRQTGSPLAEITYNNGTANQVTAITWDPARMQRGLKLTIGVGYEYDPMFARKDVLLTVNGKVVWRTTQPTLSLAGTLRPSFAAQSSTAQSQMYMHGARLRLWRFKG